MKDFNYCIWLLPEKKHKWYEYITTFTPHMSIYTNISRKSDAILKLNNMPSCKLKVRLEGDLTVTNIDGFYSLQYNIVPVEDNIPEWWPSNAHVSFAYQYTPFSQDMIKHIRTTINEKNATMDYVVLRKCCGHYTTW